MKASLFSFILLISFAVGCGTENPFSRGPDLADDPDIGPPPGATVSFRNDVVPALAGCVSCHRSGTGGWTYTGDAGAYTAVRDVVDLGSPDESELLVKATGGDDHGGGRVIGTSSAQYEIILRWVTQGAIDN